MRVVLNSDVLFHQALVRERLSQEHVAFFEACKEGHHDVVVPLTSKLEFDRYQAQRRRETISSIRQAYGTLRRYEVPFEERDADELVPQPDLVELIKALGAEVNVVEPTDEELREAHRRACLHEAPHPPDAKSDEMRDLVIWMVALRVARESGGAVLVSRDNVHVGPAGDDEARRVDLVRRRTMDDALAYFGVATPVGQALLDVLRSSWQELKNRGLPLAEEPTLLRADQPVFISGGRGPSSMRAAIELPTEKTKRLSAQLRVAVGSDGEALVTLSSITADGEAIGDVAVEGVPARSVAFLWDAYEDRLTALRRSLGENE